MRWWEKYIGIPFKPMGRNENGVDCVGLCMLIFKNEKGVIVDDTVQKYTAEEMRHFKSLKHINKLIDDELTKWHEVSKKEIEPYDLCLYTVHGIECHAAICVDERRVLHVEEKHPVHAAPIDIPGYVLTRVLRHESQIEKKV